MDPRPLRDFLLKGQLRPLTHPAVRRAGWITAAFAGIAIAALTRDFVWLS